MSADLESSVRRIAAFLDIDASDQLVNETLIACSFDEMKKSFEALDAQKMAAGEPVKKNHIRQGGTGRWREVFSEEQNFLFDSHHEGRCRDVGLPSIDFFCF